jgi:hypothetical protein
MRAKPCGQTIDTLNGVTFGTLFRLKTFRIHGGGQGALGVVLAIDNGSKYDYKGSQPRQLIVAFEGCPVARYRLALKDIEVIRS